MIRVEGNVKLFSFLGKKLQFLNNKKSVIKMFATSYRKNKIYQFCLTTFFFMLLFTGVT